MKNCYSCIYKGNPPIKDIAGNNLYECHNPKVRTTHIADYEIKRHKTFPCYTPSDEMEMQHLQLFRYFENLGKKLEDLEMCIKLDNYCLSRIENYPTNYDITDELYPQYDILLRIVPYYLENDLWIKYELKYAGDTFYTNIEEFVRIFPKYPEILLNTDFIKDYEF